VSNDQPKLPMGKQVMEVATKVATWATIAILAFFTTTLLSLDKSSGIMETTMKGGFKAVSDTLTRIEQKQDEHSKMIVDHEARLSTMEGNRFDDEDSRQLLAEFSRSVQGMDTKIQELWKAIAEMKDTIPDEIVERLEHDMRVMQAQTEKLKDRLSDHEHK